MNKRGINAYIYLFGVIACIVVLGAIFTTTINPTKQDDPGDGWQLKDQRESSTVSNGANGAKETNNNNNDNGATSEESAGGGGGGGSSGGGSDSSSSSSGSCSERQITYKIQGYFKNETCTEQDAESNCIRKQVYCSASVINQDTVSADFDIRLVFVEDQKSKDDDYFGEQIDSFSLADGQSKTVSGQETIESTGSEGLANKVINCFFNTLDDVTVCD